MAEFAARKQVSMLNESIIGARGTADRSFVRSSNLASTALRFLRVRKISFFRLEPRYFESHLVLKGDDRF